MKEYKSIGFSESKAFKVLVYSIKSLHKSPVTKIVDLKCSIQNFNERQQKYKVNQNYVNT